ncbi:MAG TPA: PAS domain S-box protein [Sphingomicrobium sp.]|nr:PAS domain S-box protein [Sphingomicrobium sp.]
MLAGPDPEEFLDTALQALSTDTNWRAVVDDLPVPIYVTDAEGTVTYCNPACIDFSGHRPELGTDRWCAGLKVFTTTGQWMPHDQCPMEIALREKQIIRDVIVIAERADGSRMAFRPYPTPLLDENGTMTGAVNMLIDVTDEQSQTLQEQAERCRRLAGALYNRESTTALEGMADGFERTASELRTRRKT